MIDLILFFVVKVFQQLLRIFPERLSAFTGLFLGRLGYYSLGRRRAIAVNNARRISPNISDREARSTARQCFEKLGINFVELLLYPYLKKEEREERFHLDKREGVDEAFNGDRGVLILGFHYSNWELLGVMTFLLGREVVVLARPLKGRMRLNGLLNGLRASTGLTVIPNKDTARDVMRLLKENRMVAFVGDQREKRSRAVWADFFGRKVATSKGIIAIAMKTTAPVVPVYSRRDGFLRYTVVFDEPVLIERRGAPVDELIYRNATRVNGVLEKLVSERPEEWFLVHRRFGRDT